MGIIASARPDVAVTDRIVLTMPTDSRFRGVGTLVLGGIGSRLDLAYERMDDLQLALLSTLEAALDGQVTVEIEADTQGLSVAVGPLRSDAATDKGLALVLSRLVDDVEHQRRDDGAEWVALRVAAQRPS